MHMEGDTPNADAVRKLSRGGCVQMQTRRGGHKIKKKCRFHKWPHMQKLTEGGGFEAWFFSRFAVHGQLSAGLLHV